ncbi:MAG: cyclic nucleotide-binding domain-containing protein [Planctomycetota bacterium]|nr:cyclic nucleotide-binding domain-containing protein [Planctomycetota bacterium]
MSLDQFVRKVPKGAIIMKEGDVVDGFYYLQKGVVERIVGGAVVSPDISEPQILGEMGYFSGGRRTATLIAKEDCEFCHFKDIASLFHGAQRKPSLVQDLERRFMSRANDTEAALDERKKAVQKLERCLESLTNEFEERKTRFFWIADIIFYLRAERPVRKVVPRTTRRPGDLDPFKISHAAFNQWMSDWSTVIVELVEEVKEETTYLEKLTKAAEGLCFALDRLMSKYQYGWIRVMLTKLKDLNVRPEEHNLGQYISKSRETVFGTNVDDVK